MLRKLPLQLFTNLFETLQLCLPQSVYIRNSYTMGCPTVRGDNPRALASGLSYVQVDKHGITILYPYICVDLAHHEIFRAEIGKGGIKLVLV